MEFKQILINICFMKSSQDNIIILMIWFKQRWWKLDFREKLFIALIDTVFSEKEP